LGEAPKPDTPVGEAVLPSGGRQPGVLPPGAFPEVLRMAPLVTASVIRAGSGTSSTLTGRGLPGRTPQRGNSRNGRSGIASANRVTADEFEIWFDKGVTDGLPVVPPTRERVERMLAGTERVRDELLGEMPPNYGRLTVEKAAINAGLAGCRPDYLPVVIAAAEGACDPVFNLHGVSTSTHFAAPLIVVTSRSIRTRC
jgi:hypothetical protein